MSCQRQNFLAQNIFPSCGEGPPRAACDRRVCTGTAQGDPFIHRSTAGDETGSRGSLSATAARRPSSNATAATRATMGLARNHRRPPKRKIILSSCQCRSRRSADAGRAGTARAIHQPAGNHRPRTNSITHNAPMAKPRPRGHATMPLTRNGQSRRSSASRHNRKSPRSVA